MNTRTGIVVTAATATIVLAGCGGPTGTSANNDSAPAGSSSPSSSGSSSSSSSTAPSSPSTSAPSSSSSPSSSTTPASSASSGASATGSRAGSSSPGGTTQCTTRHLKVSLATSEGAAGSTYDTIRLTNTGSTACTLYGYPGVSLVGHGNGTQVGAAAVRDHSRSPRTVTVRAGRSTTFLVRITQAANYPRSQCAPTPADGLRIYPPGNTAALYLPLRSATGCAKDSVKLLTVRPVGVTT